MVLVVLVVLEVALGVVVLVVVLGVVVLGVVLEAIWRCLASPGRCYPLPNRTAWRGW